mmetsp:Transcript_4156/g.7446  ORF Transcript_4156/g.7446 Transcript_4156/m.7446 type:complete len:239 (-) Transcript_4156:462-1178(-)
MTNCRYDQPMPALLQEFLYTTLYFSFLPTLLFPLLSCIVIFKLTFLHLSLCLCCHDKLLPFMERLSYQPFLTSNRNLMHELIYFFSSPQFIFLIGNFMDDFAVFTIHHNSQTLLILYTMVVHSSFLTAFLLPLSFFFLLEHSLLVRFNIYNNFSFYFLIWIFVREFFQCWVKKFAPHVATLVCVSTGPFLFCFRNNVTFVNIITGRLNFFTLWESYLILQFIDLIDFRWMLQRDEIDR